MIFILLILLALLIMISYILNDCDIGNASTLLAGIFFISTFVTLLNYNNWNMNEHLDFFSTSIIIIALNAFLFGELCVKVFIQRYLHKKKRRIIEIEITVPSVEIAYMTCVIMCIFLIYYFYSIKNLAYAYSGSYEHMIYYAREAIVAGKDLNKIANHISCIAQCLGYLYMMFFIYLMVDKKFRIKNIIYIIPMIIYVVFIILRGERTGVIYIVAYTFIIFAFFYQNKQYWSSKSIKKIIFMGLIGLGLFFCFFRLSGFLKNSGVGTTAFKSISKYSAFSIPGFDHFLKKGFKENVYFGETTLNRIYAITNRIGITKIKVSSKYLPFYQLTPSVSSNIYTGLARYIQDFGYIGMHIVMFGLGAGYSILWNRIRYSRKIGIEIVFYGMWIYPIVMMSIEEYFFNEVLTSTLVYQIFYMEIIYLIIRKLSCKRKI